MYLTGWSLKNGDRFTTSAYRPGERCQFDLCEPKAEIPVGQAQTRRGFVVTAELPHSSDLLVH
jgi:hypothetical protein